MGDLKEKFEKAVYLDETIRPHRSLTNREQWIATGMLALPPAGVGVMSAIAGQWPITFIAVGAYAGMVIALRSSVKSGKEYQNIHINDEHLTISHYKPGGRTPIETKLSAENIKIELYRRNADKNIPGEAEHIYLYEGQDRYEIGAFLPAHEKEDFFEALKTALENRQNHGLEQKPLPGPRKAPGTDHLRTYGFDRPPRSDL